jgi:hypothetical protein
MLVDCSIRVLYNTFYTERHLAHLYHFPMLGKTFRFSFLAILNLTPGSPSLSSPKSPSGTDLPCPAGHQGNKSRSNQTKWKSEPLLTSSWPEWIGVWGRARWSLGCWARPPPPPLSGVGPASGPTSGSSNWPAFFFVVIHFLFYPTGKENFRH